MSTTPFPPSKWFISQHVVTQWQARYQPGENRFTVTKLLCDISFGAVEGAARPSKGRGYFHADWPNVEFVVVEPAPHHVQRKPTLVTVLDTANSKPTDSSRTARGSGKRAGKLKHSPKFRERDKRDYDE